MSDQPERYPYIDDSLEFRTRDGKVWGSVWWPAVHTCALPPGWVTMKTGCPAEVEKLPAAGLLSFTQTEPYETASGPAYQVEVCPTQLGWDVREAFYERRMRP